MIFLSDAHSRIMDLYMQLLASFKVRHFQGDFTIFIGVVDGVLYQIDNDLLESLPVTKAILRYIFQTYYAHFDSFELRL